MGLHKKEKNFLFEQLAKTAAALNTVQTCSLVLSGFVIKFCVLRAIL